MLLLYPQRYRSEQLSLVAALRSVQGHFIDHNALRFAPCKVETNARLNVGSTAMPLCRIRIAKSDLFSKLQYYCRVPKIFSFYKTNLCTIHFILLPLYQFHVTYLKS